MAQDTAQRAQAESPGPAFTRTQWTVVLQAMKGSENALNSLCTAYRRPLVVWAQSRRAKTEEAEDLVQGFFAQLLKHDFLANVAPEKGRFRTFLLTSFQRYWLDQQQRAARLKRGGGQVPHSLDETDDDGQLLREPSCPGAAPDQAFDRAWAQALLAKALERLRAECAQAGHDALERAIEPVLFADPDAPAYEEIARQLGMKEGAVKTAAYRIRQRLNGIVREEVLQTLTRPEDLEEELSYLRSLFAKTSIIS